MSDRPPPPSPKRSGEHAAVLAANEAYESLVGPTLAKVRALNAKSTPGARSLTMGQYAFIVVAVGPHHNSIEQDADRVFAEAVQRLKTAGHTFAIASFTHGTENDLRDPDAYLAALAAAKVPTPT